MRVPSQMMANASEPMPLLQGSTTVNAMAVANAASTALPPLRSASAPAWAANGWDVATTLRANTGTRREGYGRLQSNCIRGIREFVYGMPEIAHRQRIVKQKCRCYKAAALYFYYDFGNGLAGGDRDLGCIPIPDQTHNTFDQRIGPYCVIESRVTGDLARGPLGAHAL